MSAGAVEGSRKSVQLSWALKKDMMELHCARQLLWNSPKQVSEYFHLILRMRKR